MINRHAQFDISQPAVGRHGMVATSQPLATLAAVKILQQGGSAVDAAIAANAVLSVTEPHMCGPGGDLFALVWDANEKTLSGLNGSGRSPLALSLESLRAQLESGAVIPSRGPLTLTTPTAVAAWARLHARFGRSSWASLFESAVAIAREGFALGPRTAVWWQRAGREIAGDPALSAQASSFRQTFFRDGEAPSAGATVRNPGLARLYQVLQAGGSDAFYTGDVAAALVAAQKKMGGALCTQDLTEASAEWATPISTHYRGAEISVLPPNGQGLCALQMLNMLELFPIASMAPDDPAWWHLFLEAKKLAFADRAAYYADPKWTDLPVAYLLSKPYAQERAALIDPRVARADQTPGAVKVPAADTTYLCVADAAGNMVSLIQSLFVPFGSGIVVPEFGFALQSRASGFTLSATHPNAYAPGKRPFHTIMPGFVGRDGAPYFSFGAIGGDMQPQAQVQLLANVLDFGLNAQAAGDLPRLRHVGGASPTGLQEDPLGIAHYETHFKATTLAGLIQRGHALRAIEDPVTGFVGGYQGIIRDPVSGAYWGASDRRLDGVALGI
jgi:gamma-glutamyltranspeptidase / glutathione hydrolase